MQCILKWTVTSSNCPLCRNEFHIPVGSPQRTATRNKIRRLLLNIEELQSTIDDQECNIDEQAQEINDLHAFIDGLQ